MSGVVFLIWVTFLSTQGACGFGVTTLPEALRLEGITRQAWERGCAVWTNSTCAESFQFPFNALHLKNLPRCLKQPPIPTPNPFLEPGLVLRRSSAQGYGELQSSESHREAPSCLCSLKNSQKIRRLHPVPTPQWQTSWKNSYTLTWRNHRLSK